MAMTPGPKKKPMPDNWAKAARKAVDKLKKNGLPNQLPKPKPGNGTKGVPGKGAKPMPNPYPPAPTFPPRKKEPLKPLPNQPVSPDKLPWAPGRGKGIGKGPYPPGKGAGVRKMPGRLLPNDQMKPLPVLPGTDRRPKPLPVTPGISRRVKSAVLASATKFRKRK